MLAIAFYCMSSVALSVMIANATGPAMDVSQFVKPTATVPWTLSTMDIPPPSTPTPVTRSAYSYYYNALPAWPRFSSLGLRRKRATPKRTMTLRKVYRGGPYSPRAGYRQEDDYVQQMRGFNKSDSGFCDTIAHRDALAKDNDPASNNMLDRAISLPKP
ncbi:hypothetical protein CPC16_011019 [Podila verticillata]|nr:hypothetical protein BGZ59_005341 [Podila verticillata]KAF9378965.1 hypothetical protein CPC16_011019 [Podila verticillata]KFH64082.1 hypothetical protein MVEG_09907 [Podila verticillata NRRL 6337]